MERTKRPTRTFWGVIIFAFVLYFAMMALQPHLPHILFSYSTLYNGAAHSVFWRLIWFVGDTTECIFYKAIIGAVGIILGSVIAYLLDKHRSRYRGIPISYGTGLWPWIFCAGIVTLGISNLLFAGIRYEGDGYINSFVCYVSVASSVILIYGGNFRNMITGAVLGAITSTPIAIFLFHYVMIPLGLPCVIANVIGMSTGGIITYEICRYLPWMILPEAADEASVPAPIEGEIPIAAYKHLHPGKFFVRRMLADFSEPMFVGNDIAGFLFVFGTVVTWALNPEGVSYGNYLFPAVLLSQLLTSAVAIYVYWDGWMKEDFCATFVGIASVAPAIVCTYGGNLVLLVISSVFGAIACTPIANWFNAKIPGHWHGMTGFTFSMAFCTFFCACLVKALLVAFPVLAG